MTHALLLYFIPHAFSKKINTKIESTVRYLGVEVDDALEIAEKIEVLNRRRSRKVLLRLSK